MTVGLSKSWTSDLYFEISDLLIYVIYDVYRGIPDFRGWLCKLQPGPALATRLPGTLAIQYVTRRTE